jgi:anthranilate phosphoribosyltransferase
MDEVTLAGETRVVEVTGEAALRNYALTAAQFGLEMHPVGSARGGTKEQNAVIARGVLEGERGPARDVVVANAAMGIYVAGKARTPREGAGMAVESIDSGRASGKLNDLVEFSQRP